MIELENVKRRLWYYVLFAIFFFLITIALTQFTAYNVLTSLLIYSLIVVLFTRYRYRSKDILLFFIFMILTFLLFMLSVNTTVELYNYISELVINVILILFSLYVIYRFYRTKRNVTVAFCVLIIYIFFLFKNLYLIYYSK